MYVGPCGVLLFPTFEIFLFFSLLPLLFLGTTVPLFFMYVLRFHHTLDHIMN